MMAKAAYGNKQVLKDNIKAARGEVKAQLVIKNSRFLDVFGGDFLNGDVAIHNGTIVGTGQTYSGEHEIDAAGQYVVPGFIDSHVHIESSMMVPARFQQSVLPCGTTTAIWDPHEIANVKGAEGIRWALEASEGLDLDFFIMVPSCVPSTSSNLEFETSGAELQVSHLLPFRDHPRVLGLAEMMNFPGLLSGDDEVADKILAFEQQKRDGHCPGLTGRDLNAYGVAGIHSCHESTSLEEAREKMRKGLHVLIREGSCAKNARDLLPLVNSYSSAVLAMCSDDRNPLDIANEGHISFVLNAGLELGLRAEDLFRCASFAAARAYGLEDRGAVAPGYLADLVLVAPKNGNLQLGFNVGQVIKSGQPIDASRLKEIACLRPAAGDGQNLRMDSCREGDLRVDSPSEEATVQVIGVVPGQIVTKKEVETLPVDAQSGVQADLRKDVLKIAVFERHHHTGRKCTAFVRGFGLTKGAIATSINHDSHNVIAVGANDTAIVGAINRLRDIDGGIVVFDGENRFEVLPLPVGGLMTDVEPADIASKLCVLKELTRSLGCPLDEPFLTLSFLALPVIPALKITDRGLVDVETFAKVAVCLD